MYLIRVGFDILEEIVDASEDDSLNDNAKGFTNYAAPGADRLKISVRLTKKQLNDTEDTSFVELLKVRDGVIKKLQNKSNYNLIKDYMAERTYEESGNYALDPFIVDCVNTLNNETGNGGLFREDELTDDGNKPSNDLMAYRVSAGTAYVKGYDIDLVGSTVKDIDKPRDTKKVEAGSRVPFALGSLLRKITFTVFHLLDWEELLLVVIPVQISSLLCHKEEMVKIMLEPLMELVREKQSVRQEFIGLVFPMIAIRMQQLSGICTYLIFKHILNSH